MITKADTIIERLLRHMAAVNALKEKAEDVYEMTPFTESLADPGHSNAMNYL